MPRKSTDNDITTLHATVKVLAAVMVVVLIGVYVLQLGHENLVETNAATASDVYPATDACFNATNNATALTPPDVCSRSGPDVCTPAAARTAPSATHALIRTSIIACVPSVFLSMEHVRWPHPTVSLSEVTC